MPVLDLHPGHDPKIEPYLPRPAKQCRDYDHQIPGRRGAWRGCGHRPADGVGVEEITPAAPLWVDQPGGGATWSTAR